MTKYPHSITGNLAQGSLTILPRPVDQESRAVGIGPRIVELLLALPEPNQHWLALLGPRSVDQRQGLLCLIAAVETQDVGPRT